MSKRIFISDVHMGANDKPKDAAHDYDWLGKKEAATFAGFLNYLESYKDLEEVVLLGDLFDNWVVPIDHTPPAFQEICAAGKNKPVMDALMNLAGKVPVMIFPGNHDMGLTEKIVKELFGSKILFGGTAETCSIFRAGRLRAEHGCAHAMFNAPDPKNWPGERLPLGYFISRVSASQKFRTGESRRHYGSYIDELLELLGPQSLSQTVFDGICKDAGVGQDDKIFMPGGTPITVCEVRDKYRDLYSQWEEQVGKGLAFKAMMAEIGWLEDAADRLCKKGGTNTVIFGHSHNWALDKDVWFTNQPRIYANCGCWCDDDKKTTVVETEKIKGEKQISYMVRVLEWKDRGFSLLKEESIDTSW